MDPIILGFLGYVTRFVSFPIKYDENETVL